jgi:hypothetical protein
MPTQPPSWLIEASFFWPIEAPVSAPSGSPMIMSTAVPTVGRFPSVVPIIRPTVPKSRSEPLTLPSIGVPSVVPSVVICVMPSVAPSVVPSVTPCVMPSVVHYAAPVAKTFPSASEEPLQLRTPSLPPTVKESIPKPPVSKKEELRRLIARSTQQFEDSSTWGEFAGKCRDPMETSTQVSNICPTVLPIFWIISESMVPQLEPRPPLGRYSRNSKPRVAGRTTQPNSMWSFCVDSLWT